MELSLIPRRLSRAFAVLLVTLLSALGAARRASAASQDPADHLYLVAVGDAASVPEQYLASLCSLIAKTPASARPPFSRVYLYRVANDDILQIVRRLTENPAAANVDGATSLARLAGAIQTEEHQCASDRAAVTANAGPSATPSEGAATAGTMAPPPRTTYLVAERVAPEQPNTLRISTVTVVPSDSGDKARKTRPHTIDVTPSDKDASARRIALSAGIIPIAAAIRMSVTIHVDPEHRCQPGQADGQCVHLCAPATAIAEFQDTPWLEASALSVTWQTTCERPATTVPNQRWTQPTMDEKEPRKGGLTRRLRIAETLYRGACEVVASAVDPTTGASAAVSTQISIEAPALLVDVTTRVGAATIQKESLALPYDSPFPWSAPHLDERALVRWFSDHETVAASEVLALGERARQRLRDLTVLEDQGELAREIQRQIDDLWSKRGDAIGYDLLTIASPFGPYVEVNDSLRVGDKVCNKLTALGAAEGGIASLREAALAWRRECHRALIRLRTQVSSEPLERARLRLDRTSAQWGTLSTFSTILGRDVPAKPISFKPPSLSWDGVAAEEYLLWVILPNGGSSRSVPFVVQVHRARTPFSTSIFFQTTQAGSDDRVRFQAGAEFALSFLYDLADLRVGFDVDWRRLDVGVGVGGMLHLFPVFLNRSISGPAGVRSLDFAAGTTYDLARRELFGRVELVATWAVGPRETFRLGLSASYALGGTMPGTPLVAPSPINVSRFGFVMRH